MLKNLVSVGASLVCIGLLIWFVVWLTNTCDVCTPTKTQACESKIPEEERDDDDGNDIEQPVGMHTNGPNGAESGNTQSDKTLAEAVLHKLRWREFQLQQTRAGQRVLYIRASSGFGGTRDTTNKVVRRTAPWDVSIPGTVIQHDGHSSWMDSVCHYFEAEGGTDLPDNTVVVLVFGRYLHRDWSLRKQTNYSQGTAYLGCTWYTKDNILHFRKNSGTSVWPLSLPDPAHVHVPKAVVITSPTEVDQRTTHLTIHQTWKSFSQLTYDTKWCLDRVKSLNNSEEHWFWSDDACEYLVRHYFDPRVWQLYSGLVPGAYKADVWRLCALYAFGGVYLDIDMEMIEPVRSFVDQEGGVQVCRDVPHYYDLELTDHKTNRRITDYYLYNAIIASPLPGQEFFRFALLRALSHVWGSFHVNIICTFPLDPLFPTGPCSLGLAWLDYHNYDQSKTEKGVCAQVTEQMHYNNAGNIITSSRNRGGEPVAMTKNSVGDGTCSDYLHLFATKQWFRETENFWFG